MCYIEMPLEILLMEITFLAQVTEMVSVAFM